MTIFFPYFLFFLFKEMFEGLAIGLSFPSGKSLQQNERSAKNVETVIYENIYKKCTNTMSNQFVTIKSMFLLWGLSIIGKY